MQFEDVYKQILTQSLQFFCQFCKQLLQYPVVAKPQKTMKLQFTFMHDCTFIVPVHKIIYIFFSDQMMMKIEYYFLTDDLDFFLSSLQLENPEKLFLLPVSNQTPEKQTMKVTTYLRKKKTFQSFRELTSFANWKHTYNILLSLDYSSLALFPKEKIISYKIFTGIFINFALRSLQLTEERNSNYLREFWVCGYCSKANTAIGFLQNIDSSFYYHLFHPRSRNIKEINKEHFEYCKFVFTFNFANDALEIWQRTLNI